MLRLPFYVLVALSVAFGGGIWFTVTVLGATSGLTSLSVGPWQAYPELQTKRADPYARAQRSDDGRLLLGRAEGLLFTARSDSEGAPLTGNCVYRLEGRTPAARFWSIRVTDEQGRPLESPAEMPSGLQSWRLLQAPDGTFTATIGGPPRPGNWIALSHGGPFRLALTLIDTPTAASVGLNEIDMPAILRSGCADA